MPWVCAQPRGHPLPAHSLSHQLPCRGENPTGFCQVGQEGDEIPGPGGQEKRLAHLGRGTGPRSRAAREQMAAMWQLPSGSKSGSSEMRFLQCWGGGVGSCRRGGRSSLQSVYLGLGPISSLQRSREPRRGMQEWYPRVASSSLCQTTAPPLQHFLFERADVL